MRSEYDYTAMSTFQTCKRKYYYRMERGLERKAQFTAPAFGNAIHKALDSWFVDKDVDKAINIFRGNYVENLEIDDKRTYKMGEWILKNYHAKYQDQPFKLLKTEHTFKHKLPNGNYLTGRIDKIIEWHDAIWIVDHKTTSQLGAQYFKMAEPNLQFDGYTWAARQEGFNAIGVIVDAILVAKGLLDSTQRQRLTPLARYDSYRSEERLQEFLGVVCLIQDEIANCAETNVWTPNFGACIDYGECAYRKVCLEDSMNMRERIIDLDYIVSPWNPLEEAVK